MGCPLDFCVCNYAAADKGNHGSSRNCLYRYALRLILPHTIWIFINSDHFFKQINKFNNMNSNCCQGGLFETTSDPAIEMAFDYSMKTLDLGGRSRLSRVPSTSPGSVEMLNPDDSFAASKKGYI